jgi:hypothetical protein
MLFQEAVATYERAIDADRARAPATIPQLDEARQKWDQTATAHR